MMVRNKVLVLDANVLIRAVLGPRVRELIFRNASHVSFFTPCVCLDDARKYLPEILVARQVDPAPAMNLLEGIAQHVQILEYEWLEDFEQTAKERMQKRDLADWPVLAAALALGCPIWTHDADFFGVGVVTWSTQHIESFFE